MVRVAGKSAHAGLNPEAGASAILELAHVIQKLHALNDPGRGISVNVGKIDGGIGANVVAPTSTAMVDVRVRTSEDARWIERAIRGLQPVTPGTRLEIEGAVDLPPLEPTPRNRTLWEAARRVGQEIGLELEEGLAGGVSDGNTISLYTSTLDGLGAVGDGAHAQHEFLDVDAMPKRCAPAGPTADAAPADRTGRGISHQCFALRACANREGPTMSFRYVFSSMTRISDLPRGVLRRAPREEALGGG